MARDRPLHRGPVATSEASAAASVDEEWHAVAQDGRFVDEEGDRVWGGAGLESGDRVDVHEARQVQDLLADYQAGTEGQHVPDGHVGEAVVEFNGEDLIGDPVALGCEAKLGHSRVRQNEGAELNVGGTDGSGHGPGTVGCALEGHVDELEVLVELDGDHHETLGQLKRHGRCARASEVVAHRDLDGLAHGCARSGAQKTGA
mmetsp:Transcript_20903/g.48846  ORF Transcript_20903/g.48846 Transcript_20903/m.48846 type:complete len:202 (-) Transcript_20903:9883-10488(-)